MPNFVVTTVGAMAASTASPSGPRIRLTEFRLGSNSTTPATPGDTALAGSTVYTGVPSHFSLFDETTVQVILEVPASAGPFSYGEIGIYLAGGVLFARFSYGELKTKTSTSITGYAEIRRIHALLRIEQNPAVFDFFTSDPPLVTEYPNLTYVVAPSIIASTPIVIVHEPTPYQDSILLHSHTDNLWTIDDYPYVGSATVTASDDNNVTATFFGTLGNTAVPGKYLIQTATGQIRSVNSITGNVANVLADFAPTPSVSAVLFVYEAVESIAQRTRDLAVALTDLRADFDADQLAVATAAVGQITYRPYTVPEPLELECNGAAISRSYFSVLFGKIGTYYGAGNGTTTFNIPDLRGLVIRGHDHGRGLDSGRVFGSYQADAVGTHSHTTPFGTPAQADGNIAIPTGGLISLGSGTTNAFGEIETRVKNSALLPVIRARTGFEIGSPPPPEAVLTITPNPASLVYVLGDPIVNQVVATYGPVGNATLGALSGAMPVGLTLTDDGVSSLLINGTPTAVATTSATYPITQGIYSGSFTFNAEVLATAPPAPASPVVAISPQVVDSPLTTFGNTRVGYNIQNDGSVMLYRPNQTIGPVYEYPSGEWFVSGDMSNVEVRATFVSGSTLWGGSSPLGTWLDVTITRNWELSGSMMTGPISAIITVELRDATTLVVLDVANINFQLT